MQELQSTVNKLNKLKTELKKVVFGRDEIIDTIVLGLASNQHILLMGKHGEAKSFLVHKLGGISGLKTFYKQLHKETIVKDIVGLINPIEFSKGNLRVLKTKFWESNIMFFDEFLRARTEFLDFLLEVMMERRTSKTVEGDTTIPVISCICTTNPLTEEYNTERLDLALKDRFFAILNIDHLIESNGSRKALENVLKLNGTTIEDVSLTYEELIGFFKEARKRVNVDDAVVLAMFEKAHEMGFNFSSRRIQLMKWVLQTHCLMNGRDVPSTEDYFYVGQILLGNYYPELDTEKIRDIIDEAVVSSEHRDTIRTANKLTVLSENANKQEEFITKSVKFLGDLDSVYPELPKRVRQMIDGISDRVAMSVKKNLGLMTPQLAKKLDTEKFKPLLTDFIIYNGITTSYLKGKDIIDCTKLIKAKCKNCVVRKEEGTNAMTKFLILPQLEKVKSFTEISATKPLLVAKGFLRGEFDPRG